jgi:hypothetical protein
MERLTGAAPSSASQRDRRRRFASTSLGLREKPSRKVAAGKPEKGGGIVSCPSPPSSSWSDELRRFDDDGESSLTTHMLPPRLRCDIAGLPALLPRAAFLAAPPFRRACLCRFDFAKGRKSPR